MTYDEQLVHLATFTIIALLDLVHCLKNNGALGARQYEAALRSTIEADGAQRERPDYARLARLLATLEAQRPGEPPMLDQLH